MPKDVSKFSFETDMVLLSYTNMQFSLLFSKLYGINNYNGWYSNIVIPQIFVLFFILIFTFLLSGLMLRDRSQKETAM